MGRLKVIDDDFLDSPISVLLPESLASKKLFSLGGAVLQALSPESRPVTVLLPERFASRTFEACSFGGC